MIDCAQERTRYQEYRDRVSLKYYSNSIYSLIYGFSPEKINLLRNLCTIGILTEVEAMAFEEIFLKLKKHNPKDNARLYELFKIIDNLADKVDPEHKMLTNR